MKKLTLKRLYNTKFKELYWKLLTKPDEMDVKEYEILLSLGMYFVGRENEHIRKLGYRLFLLYSKQTTDYKPLYELSLNKGLIPISQFIYENMRYGEDFGNLHTEINTAVNKEYKVGDQYKTVGQSELYESVRACRHSSYIVVAPTSYGKTELILSFLDTSKHKNICIVTPTKSLLAQTKKRILNHIGTRKIITQPEMYSEGESNIIAVLTQERLLRLLQNNPNLKFDILVIDEAHNLLDKFSKSSSRSILLASVIIICHTRNEHLSCRYLTPFLSSRDSIILKYIAEQPEWFTVSETMKSEMFYVHDLDANTFGVLDQFSGDKEKIVHKEKKRIYSKDAEIVLDYADKKNIIYLNTPKKIESFAKELASILGVSLNDKIKKAVSDLREFIHEDYELANNLERGVIYHHGSVPEFVRYYIENLYSDVPEIRYIIANSTLLEGVNIPATKMFILDPKRGNGNLKSSDFKNLIGRVCRFGDIFNPETGNLDYLLPEIHIIKGKYCSERFNVLQFFKSRHVLAENEDDIKDEIFNPLLKNHEQIDKDVIEQAEVMLENFSDDNILTGKIVATPKSLIGKLCFQNNVRIFDILLVEEKLNAQLAGMQQAHKLENVFSLMKSLFFDYIAEDENSSNNIKRLKEQRAQQFYMMLINWRMSGKTLKEMIAQIVAYWNRLNKQQSEFVYVGKWGDKTRGTNSHQKYWTDIGEKSNQEKVNLAIVRLKEEFDFIDNEIIKYIEILYSLELIEEKLYLKLKYGTSNKDKIALLNCGISNTLTNILFDKYKEFYEVNTLNNEVSFKKKLIETMRSNGENGILISELSINLPVN